MDKYAVRDYYGGFSIMKITKILGAASAAVVSAAVMAASAGAYEAFLMYASSDLFVPCTLHLLTLLQLMLPATVHTP